MTQTTTAQDLGSQLVTLKQKEAQNRETEIRLKAEFEGIDRDLTSARARAKEEFGTDDLNEMRSLFTTYSQQDKAAVGAFAETVNRRTKLLDDIQQRLNAHRAGQPIKA